MSLEGSKRPKARFFEGPYYMFSNFSAFTAGEYPTGEHRYQAHKFDESQQWVRELIRSAPSPYEAKEIAHEHRKLWRPDWCKELKLKVMRKTVHLKRMRHGLVEKTLLECRGKLIIEDNPNDSFWGIGDGTGRNWLGRIWMEELELIVCE